jgi:hypothetical protein
MNPLNQAWLVLLLSIFIVLQAAVLVIMLWILEVMSNTASRMGTLLGMHHRTLEVLASKSAEKPGTRGETG